MKTRIHIPTLSLLAVLLCFAPKAHAHAVRAENMPANTAVVVAFTYTTGDIPAYVQVEVYAPGNDDVEFQNGRTDALGRFAFTPDKPGAWAVVMSDGMGHKLRHVVEVTAGDSSADSSAATAPGVSRAAVSSTPERALLGVSLLCNIFVGAALWRGRKSRA